MQRSYLYSNVRLQKKGNGIRSYSKRTKLIGVFAKLKNKNIPGIISQVAEERFEKSSKFLENPFLRGVREIIEMAEATDGKANTQKLKAVAKALRELVAKIDKGYLWTMWINRVHTDGYQKYFLVNFYCL